MAGRASEYNEHQPKKRNDTSIHDHNHIHNGETPRQTVAAAALRLCNSAMCVVHSVMSCSEDGSDSAPTLAKRRVGLGVACTHPRSC